MSLSILFHFLCAQHVSDINTSIIRSLRLCCGITTSVVLFSVRCVLEIWCVWVGVVSVLQAAAGFSFSLLHWYHSKPATPKRQHTSKQEHTTNVAIQQNSHKLLMMDILMSETCWAHKKWNKIASDIMLVFYSSTIVGYFHKIIILVCWVKYKLVSSFLETVWCWRQIIPPVTVDWHSAGMWRAVHWQRKNAVLRAQTCVDSTEHQSGSCSRYTEGLNSEDREESSWGWRHEKRRGTTTKSHRVAACYSPFKRAGRTD